MQQTSIYATGANPTLVQNDEHILVKGHRPGHSIVRVYKWGMGCDRLRSVVAVWSITAGRMLCLQVAGVSGVTFCMLPWITCQMLLHIW